MGQYFVVDTDAPQPGKGPGQYWVSESLRTPTTCWRPSTSVTPVPADLVVTNVSIPTVNYSGESMTFSYTVENEGSNPVWEGTQYWTDFIWVSPEPTFNRYDASFLGQTTHAQTTPSRPARANRQLHSDLPPGTSGQYYLYIDLDAHNDLPPALYTYQARLETTDWWPADTGDNSYWLGEFTEWAFENPDNNRIATPFDIIYSEPDLTVTNITVPSNVVSGSTIPITYTVTNRGTRATRTNNWTDRIFLSQDPSLDTYDTALGPGNLRRGAGRRVRLTPRQWTCTFPTASKGISTSSSTPTPMRQTNYEVQSDIGYGNYGITDRRGRRAQPLRPGLRGDPKPGAGQCPPVRRRSRQDRIGAVAHHAGASA